MANSLDYASDQAANGTAHTTVQAVTIQEAARHLGVSVETVRRRLRSKQLIGQKRKTPQGFEWRVLLPTEVVDAGEAAVAQSGGHASPSHTLGAPPSQDAAARELVRLEAHNADLQTQLAEYRTELEARRREVQELHVIIARLAPPPPALPSPDQVDIAGVTPGDQAVDQAPPTQTMTPDDYAARATPTREVW